ncbi:MAG: hypothetical protein RLZZ596_2883 [Pseudomonadota bacterium]|jgi:uncharacterized protein
MSTFLIHTLIPGGREGPTLRYDNLTSLLTDSLTGQSVVKSFALLPSNKQVFATSKDTPARKDSPRILKISLGLSCNYECEYCSQRFVPRAAETNPAEVQSFIDGLDEWVTLPPERIEFWGGEPLVYIKTLRPLAQLLRSKYPSAHFSVITNGSLLNAEVNEWLDDMEFSVGISHDGPGQHVRGPDPLDDPEKRAAIMDLYQRLAPKGRVSFNAMLNRSNISRAAIQQFFTDLTGDPEVMIAEGAFVDAYDPGGLALSLPPSEAHAFRRSSFQEIRQGKADRVSGARDRVASFINSLRLQRTASSVSQKCGMDSTEAIAVDLRGNVLTCQNVSAQSTAPNGESHRIGHVSSLASVTLRTATHWSKRDECPKCPVLHICKGACMFLEGPLWEASCNNAYSDALPIFASGIEFLTGLVPVFIDGDLPKDRKDVFGLTQTNPTGDEVTRKPFPVRVVTS